MKRKFLLSSMLAAIGTFSAVSGYAQDKTPRRTLLHTKNGDIVLVSVGATRDFRKGNNRGTKTVVKYKFETPPPTNMVASEDTTAWLVCDGKQVGPDYKVKTSARPDRKGVFKDTLLFAGGDDLRERHCELHAIQHIYVNGEELGAGVSMILRLHEPPRITRLPAPGSPRYEAHE